MIMMLMSSCANMKQKAILNEKWVAYVSQALKLPDHFEMDFEFATDTVSLSELSKGIQIKVTWKNISDKPLLLYPDGYMTIQYAPLAEHRFLIEAPIVAIKEQESIDNKVFLGVQDLCERTYTFKLNGILAFFENKIVDVLCLMYMSPVLSLGNTEQIDVSNTPFGDILLSESTRKLMIVP